MVKVLIVDDEADIELLIRERYRKQIRNGELEFVFARDGQEALTKLQEDSNLEIVLSDINMPVMDGLTLLSRLTGIDRVLKAVIVSAYSDMGNIRTAMNRGAFDFLTKPLDFRDFDATLQKTIQELEAIKEGIRAREQLTHNLETLLRICRELSATRSHGELQRKLLENILEVVPGDTGTVLFFEDGTEQPSSTFTLSRHNDSDREIVIRHDLLKRIFAEGCALWSNRSNGAESGEGQSVLSDDTGAVLAVPLYVSDRITGVIYMEATNPEVRFDEGHLSFMTGVAAMAGIALENVRQFEWLQSENRRLQEDFNLNHTMVGDSPRMKDVYRTIAKVAPSDSTVLILGESGTGKELAARAIHSNSGRSEKPFVAINCAALTETLLESELFGHEKGAFTGAVTQKKGKLEIAEGGTVFLDEVAELSPTIQAKLLRVLQERQFERVGGTRSIGVNIRVVAATNKNFEQLISEGKFRLDLYYRLNVVSFRMPALRERRDDIPSLAQHFLGQGSKKSGRPIKGISPDAKRYLINHDWPGNVRELENAIERAIVLGTTENILPEDLPETIVEKPLSPDVETTEYHLGVLNAKRRLILDAMHRAGGNYTNAARLLGLHPNNLHRLIRDLELKHALQKES
jgi:DNA-binding NtrC family response regulator